MSSKVQKVQGLKKFKWFNGLKDEKVSCLLDSWKSINFIRFQLLRSLNCHFMKYVGAGFSILRIRLIHETQQ